MSATNEHYPVILNGKPLEQGELANLAFAGFAHFTALQVRQRAIKGWDLHLARLQQASRALFQQTLSDEYLSAALSTAINSGPAAQSLTATLFVDKGEFSGHSANALPSLLIRASEPHDGPLGPLRLAAFEYQRPLAHIKHVGEIGKTYYLHQAIQRGFDDALFITPTGDVSEGSIWNLAFWDGDSVIWPKAPMLTGTMMGIFTRQLKRLGIPQRTEVIPINQLGSYCGAAVMNSWTAGIEVAAIEETRFAHSDQLVALLQQAYQAEPNSRLIEAICDASNTELA